MRPRLPTAAPAAALLVLLAACSKGGSIATDDTTGSGDTQDTTDTTGDVPDTAWTLDPDLYPRAVGDVFTSKSPDGSFTVTRTTTSCEAVTVPDCVTGKSSDHTALVEEESSTEAPGAKSVRYLEAVEAGLVRLGDEDWQNGSMSKQTWYSPYFLRVPAPPYTPGTSVEESHTVCRNGAPIRTERYRYEVLRVEKVTVPAGTFSTVLVERTDPSDGSRKRYWLADGVGKVQQEDLDALGNVVRTEQLSSYTLGTGSCP